jgi:uncharacterized SAM-binding protein YcdF (DUF218 family)
VDEGPDAFTVFFLSKLLPLLLYPLGVASVFIVVAIATALRKPARARYYRVIALAILFLGGNRWVSFALVRSLEEIHVPTAPPPRADAIVVLGGATEPAFPPRPNVHVIDGDRLVYAAILYRAHKAPFVIVSGGSGLWRSGDPAESAGMSTLIQLMGVPASAIIQEAASANTYQEAANVRKLLKVYHLQRILLVTSAVHMPRAFRTFRHQGIDAVAAPTDFLVTNHDVEVSLDTFQELILSLMPDVDNLRATTEVLKEYIGLMYYRARGWL